MKLLDDDIKEYQTLCLKLKLGSKSHDAAASELQDIVGLMKIVYSPITVSDVSALESRIHQLYGTTNKDKNGKIPPPKAAA